MTHFEQKVSEPKPSKCGRFMVRTVKVGNRVQGHIEAPKLKPGERPQAIYWMGPTVAYLAANGNLVRVDRTTVGGLAMYGVKKIGLRLDDGTVYLGPISRVTDAPYERPQRFVSVPYSEWEVTLPPEEVRVESVMKKMRVAGRGSKSAMTVPT